MHGLARHLRGTGQHKTTCVRRHAATRESCVRLCTARAGYCAQLCAAGVDACGRLNHRSGKEAAKARDTRPANPDKLQGAGTSGIGGAEFPLHIGAQGCVFRRVVVGGVLRGWGGIWGAGRPPSPSHPAHRFRVLVDAEGAGGNFGLAEGAESSPVTSVMGRVLP